MIKLDIDQVVKLHEMLIERTGGDTGLRDRGLLESSIYQAYASFDGKDLYPTTLDKIARQTYALVSNHPFVDGNKRIGVFVMLVLLDLNGIKLLYEQKELIQLGLGLAQSTYYAEDVRSWIEEHKPK